MDSLILADDSLLEFCFEILKLIGIRFCDLRSRDAGPLGKDYGNIVYRKCACEAVLIRLDLILEERELFRQLLLFLLEGLGSFEILSVYGGLLLCLYLLDLLLEIVLYL